MALKSGNYFFGGHSITIDDTTTEKSLKYFFDKYPNFKKAATLNYDNDSKKQKQSTKGSTKSKSK